MKSSDAIDLVKKMGLKVYGLEYEAEEIWAKLDEMAMSNPIEYQQFLDQTLKNGDPNQPNNEEDDSALSFRPNAGICLKFTSIGGSDGLKVREVNQGKTCYINFVSHKGVNPPKTAHRKVATLNDFMHSQDIEVPLVIGKVRDINILEVKSIVLDVVFHPTVIDFGKSKEMKQQLATLVIDSLLSELNLVLKRDWQEVSERYIGGLGVDKIIPVLFFIDSKESTTSSGNNNSNNKSTNNTATKVISISSLLDEKHNEQSSNSSTAMPEDILKLNTNPSKTAKNSDMGNIIQSGFLLNKNSNSSNKINSVNAIVEHKQAPSSLSSSSSVKPSSTDVAQNITSHNSTSVGNKVLVEEISSTDVGDIATTSNNIHVSSASNTKLCSTSDSAISSSSSGNSIHSSRVAIIKEHNHGKVSVSDTHSVIIITISELKKDFQMNNAVIDVSTQQIKAQLYDVIEKPNQYDVIIQGNPNCFDTTTSKAVYSRKKQQLQLTINCDIES